MCHGTRPLNWTSATFNHATTGFALTGTHTSLQCAQCHVNNNYSLTSGACWNCHQTDYNSTNNPPHKAAQLPAGLLAVAIPPLNWTGATFNHATTGFALVGVHASQQCAACHVNNNYNLTSAACLTATRRTTTAPTIRRTSPSGFPQDCTLCHGARSPTGPAPPSTTPPPGSR